jgi:hypothetical protein
MPSRVDVSALQDALHRSAPVRVTDLKGLPSFGNLRDPKNSQLRGARYLHHLFQACAPQENKRCILLTAMHWRCGSSVCRAHQSQSACSADVQGELLVQRENGVADDGRRAASAFGEHGSNVGLRPPPGCAWARISPLRSWAVALSV